MRIPSAALPQVDVGVAGKHCSLSEANSQSVSLATLKLDRPSSVCAGASVASKSALRFSGTLLSRALASLPAPWPDGGPESLGSP
ncbi:hypothetical protein PoB_004588300 [Plakobranchus ocellatus]|uniref:Uncharacterized protein n=1 Tax=Plakobranchus ocellatus TaxID=259542 RepID=A0AAV4BKP8_9GAST|nr:hypothetical protein PoB_004588300 [Plakobranchus ocellatus]